MVVEGLSQKNKFIELLLCFGTISDASGFLSDVLTVILLFEESTTPLSWLH